MIGPATLDWATLCGESVARTSRTTIRRPRRRDTKSFIWLDTPKTQRMFREERAYMNGHRQLFGSGPELRAPGSDQPTSGLPTIHSQMHSRDKADCGIVTAYRDL